MKGLTKFIISILILLSFNCKNETKNTVTRSKKSSKSVNVSIIDATFRIDSISSEPKKIWVYLPPDYYHTEKNYPVIYMHDGQNLFDSATSFIREWEVDETLDELFEVTGKGFIVVAPENGGKHRTAEYTPWTHEKYGGGKGDNYIKFLKNTLKPYIDSTYRTKPQQKYTGLIGSSLGGLISYYGGLKYPETFGKIGVLSPSFWYSKEIVPFTKKYAATNTLKMYFLLGDKEGMTDDFNNTINLLTTAGFPENNKKSKLVPGGEHNEIFWKNEFLEVIKFLYDI